MLQRTHLESLPFPILQVTYSGGGGANAAVAGEDEAAEEVDPYDLVEAADILKILQVMSLWLHVCLPPPPLLYRGTALENGKL